MEAYRLTQQITRRAVLIALRRHHSELKIAVFLNAAQTFVYEVRTDLPVQVLKWHLRKKSKRHTRRSDVGRTRYFLRRLQATVSDPLKSIRAIGRQLQVADSKVSVESLKRWQSLGVHKTKGN